LAAVEMEQEVVVQLQIRQEPRILVVVVVGAVMVDILLVLEKPGVLAL
jgi:hypothetical protein